MENTNPLIVYILGSAFFMLLFSIVLVSFFNFSKKKVTNAKLAMQEKELKFQEELLENTVRTQEEERDRIAKDLHDEVASKLNIIHLNLHRLRKMLPDTPEVREVMSYMDSSLKESTQRTRTISHELMPPLLKKFGLLETLHDLAYSVNATEQLDFSLKNEELLDLKNDLNALHLYRIVQELANNTLKYAKATSIILAFEKVPNDNTLIKMTYTDNGVGFEVERTKGGAGMTNIETRIRLLHGTLQLSSKPMEGIVATFKFPNHD